MRCRVQTSNSTVRMLTIFHSMMDSVCFRYSVVRLRVRTPRQYQDEASPSPLIHSALGAAARCLTYLRGRMARRIRWGGRRRLRWLRRKLSSVVSGRLQIQPSRGAALHTPAPYLLIAALHTLAPYLLIASSTS